MSIYKLVKHGGSNSILLWNTFYYVYPWFLLFSSNPTHRINFLNWSAPIKVEWISSIKSPKMKKKMSNNMYHICNECNRFVPHQSVHLWTVEELDVEQTQCMKLWWVQLPRLQIQSQLSPTPTSLVRVDRLHSLKDSFIHFNKGYRIEQFKWKFLISEEN